HIDGMVIMYADHVTDSIRNAVAETERRRRKQIQYNKKNQITPQSVIKPIPDKISAAIQDIDLTKSMARIDLVKLATETETAMKRFAEDLDFEKAIEFRERLIKIKRAIGEPIESEVS
ncbi:MAG: UvrB/UvrC motif-containing protein, partial [Nitrososphaeraceae archaeon]